MKPPSGGGWSAGLSAAAVSVVLCLSALGCSKDKESLVVVSVQTEDTGGGTLTSLTLSVAGTLRTFALPAGLAMTPTEFGLYVSGDVTGSQNVNAVATEPTGCRGYKGAQPVDISVAGSTVQVTITIKPATVCAPDGGAGATGQAGSSGQAGSGGHAGSSGGGTSGSPPSLQTCVEYQHNDPSNPCDFSSGVGDTYVWSVAFSPSGQLLVTGGDDGRAVVWNFDGRTPTPAGHVFTGTGHGIAAFSPDGSQLAIGWDGEIDLYTVSGWSRSRTLAVSNEIVDLTFTPDGQQIISADTDGSVGNLYVHSALAGGSLSPTFTQPLTILPNQLALGPATASGYPVAVALGDGNVDIFALTSTGFQGPSNTLAVSSDGGAYVVRISPSGSVLASGGGDGLVYFWQFPISSTASSAPNVDVGTAFDSDYIDGIAFSPTGDRLAIASGFFQAASIWDVAVPRSLVGSNTSPSWDMLSVAFSPNGNVLAGGEFDCGVFLICAD